MNVCAVGLAVMMSASIGLVSSDCTRDAQTYICQEIPQSFPDGLSSLVLIMEHVGEINSSVFHSESLASVTRLTVTKAGITNISTGALNPLMNLTSLILDQNSITQITPFWFSQPAALKDLSLVQNQIEVLENSMLRGLTGLTKLNLAQNVIRNIAPGSFVSQTRLRKLNLSGNRLTRVDPLVFLPLSSASLRLDGNPWDCACGAEDFVSFLRDLHNASLLEREMEVTCETPETLKDQPVWNVSKCAIPSPTDDLVEPTSPTIRIAMSTLTGLIVILCVLVTVVCAVGLIYRTKQRRKQVKPTSEVEEEEENGAELANAPRESHRKCVDSEEVFDWDPELVWTASQTGVRAKSANAVLSTVLLCGDGRGLHKVKSGIEAETNTSLDNTKKQVGSEEGTMISDAKTTGELNVKTGLTHDPEYPSSGVTGENDSDALSAGNGGGNQTRVYEDTETIPYLSIGGCADKPMNQGQGSQMAQAIGRVSTWPPNSSQWKNKCATWEEGLSPLFLVPKSPQEPKFKGDTGNFSASISLEDGTSVKGLEPVLTDTSSPESEQREEPAEEDRQPDNEPASPDHDSETPEYVDPAMESTVQSEPPNKTEPTTGSVDLPLELQDSIQLLIAGHSEPLSESLDPPVDSRQSQLSPVGSETASAEFEICPEDGSESTAESDEPQSDQIRETVSQTQLSQAAELDSNPKGTTDMSDSSGSQNRSTANQGGSERAQEPGDGVGISQAPPSGGSPSDEILLGNNDYVFSGLLHEVVQNHGRWTRARWRQTHQNKLLYRPKRHEQ